MAACARGAKMKRKCPPKKVAREFAHKPEGGYRDADDARRRIKGMTR